jgi:hypothetical protein
MDVRITPYSGRAARFRDIVELILLSFPIELEDPVDFGSWLERDIYHNEFFLWDTGYWCQDRKANSRYLTPLGRNETGRAIRC